MFVVKPPVTAMGPWLLVGDTSEPLAKMGYDRQKEEMELSFAGDLIFWGKKKGDILQLVAF